MSPQPGQFFLLGGIFVPQTLHFLLFWEVDIFGPSAFEESLSDSADWSFFLFSNVDCFFLLAIRGTTNIPMPIPICRKVKKSR